MVTGRGKSAIQAVGVTRKRCWRYNWVLEFDIKGLFDNIDYDLLLRAVEHHLWSSSSIEDIAWRIDSAIFGTLVIDGHRHISDGHVVAC